MDQIFSINVPDVVVNFSNMLMKKTIFLKVKQNATYTFFQSLYINS